MTCIVGLEYKNKVFLGGDIQGTGGNNKVVHTQPKVFHKKDLVFGYTTSYRFGQILEHNLVNPVIPEKDEEIYKWLVTVLVPDIKTILKSNDYSEGGNCLIGIRGQLWDMQNDFSVLRSVRGFGSVGSGYEYAMGSISTSLNKAKPTSETIAKNIIKNAILTAGTFSPSVGQDSVIIST